MDQLAQLKDIHLPEQVHQWPIALGWWILLAILIATVVYAVNAYLKQRRLTSVKRQAIKQLQSYEELSTEQCVSILKWASMHYFTRQDIAALHGNDLLAFLSGKLDADKQAEFTSGMGESLNQYYRPHKIDIYGKDVQQATLFWFNNANLYGKKAAMASTEVNHD